MFSFFKKVFNRPKTYKVLTGNGVLFKNGRIGIVENDKSCITTSDDFHPIYINLSLYNKETLKSKIDNNYDIIAIGELKTDKYINKEDFSLRKQIFSKELKVNYFYWHNSIMFHL